MRSSPIVVCLAALALLLSPSASRGDDNAKLVSISITFHTRGGVDIDGNGKKQDTRVDIYETSPAINSDTHACAMQLNIASGTAFNDPSDCGPYPLVMVAPINKSDFLAGTGVLDVHPTTAENWMVAVEIDAKFDDGSTVTVQSRHMVFTAGQLLQEFKNAPEN